MSDEEVGVFEIRNGKIAFPAGAVVSREFGKSIHYCNLNINGTNVNHIFKAFSPNVLGLGMAFVKQREPGPISDSILLDAFGKLREFA
jgi:hypothetical protein